MDDTDKRSGRERVEFFRGADGQWYFRRVAANNEVVADSEGYEQRDSARGTAEKLFGDLPWFENRGADTEVWVSVEH